jgi:hypothetical protein
METFLAMSRGPQLFTQHQMTRALKAVAKSGVKEWRLEITDGKRTIVLSGGAAPPDPQDRNEWDDVK